jgi:hypothetical protein
MSLDEPKNLAEWLCRVKTYEDAIFVREQVAGKWQSIPLNFLCCERWGYHVARMLEAGIVPTRVIPESERRLTKLESKKRKVGK